MSTVLSLQNLNKSFGGLGVTRSVTFDIGPSERVALIGPNGAGKTTLVDLISGRLKPDSGEVHFEGHPVTTEDDIARVRRGIVRSFQITSLFPEYSAKEHVALAILQRTGRAGRLWGSVAGMTDITAETEGVLTSLGLRETADIPVAQLAYGQQRLVEIAIALALKPRLLILDEPAAGVARNQTGRIEAALDALPADVPILLIDHDLDLVFRFARRVIVLAEGAIIFDGSLPQAAKDPAVRRAYLGSYADAGSAA